MRLDPKSAVPRRGGVACAHWNLDERRRRRRRRDPAGTLAPSQR